MQPHRVRVTLQLTVYRQSVRLGAEPLETHDQHFFLQMNTRIYSPYVTTSLTSGWVCRLQFLLALTSAVILWSESRGTRDRVSTVPDSRLAFSSSLTTRRATVEVFEPASTLDSPVSQSQSHIATDGQSTSKSWRQAPSRGYSLTVTVLFLWGALSDEWAGLFLCMLALASVVFLGSESLGTRDHTLLSQNRDVSWFSLYSVGTDRTENTVSLLRAQSLYMLMSYLLSRKLEKALSSVVMSQYYMTVIKLTGVGWTGHVARMDKIRNIYIFWSNTWNL
jgi:hypothetical protein